MNLDRFIRALKNELGFANATIEKLERAYLLPNQGEGVCRACGAEEVTARHTLSPMLVEALYKFREAVFHYGRNRIHFRDDMGAEGCAFKLSFDQINNMSKLRYHGLIAHADKENTRSGFWVLTSRGNQFLQGEIQIPRVALSRNDRVIGHEGESISIKDIEGGKWLVRDTSEHPERPKVATTAPML